MSQILQSAVTPASPAMLACIAIDNADARHEDEDYTPLTPQQRKELLDLIPADFLSTNADTFTHAVSLIMHKQTDADSIKAFDDILACPAMMQAEPAECALALQRLMSYLPHSARETKADFILKGEFGKRVANAAPSSYADLVSCLTDFAPGLVEKTHIGTYQVVSKYAAPRQVAVEPWRQYILDEQARLAEPPRLCSDSVTAIFLKPSLGLPPLIELVQDGATYVKPLNQRNMTDIPANVVGDLAQNFQTRAHALGRTFPEAAAAIRTALAKLEPVG